MDINIRYLPFDVNKWDVTRIIAAVVHSPEFIIRRDEDAVDRPINFEVQLNESKAGGVGNDGSGVLTFPTDAIGHKFLNWVKITPLKIQNKKVRFYIRGKAWEKMAARLAKTRFVSPDIEEKHQEILWKLQDRFRVDAVQFGVLYRRKYPTNPKDFPPRAFSIEWERQFVEQSEAWLSFEYGHRLIRITLGNEMTDELSLSIAISINSISKIAAGYDGNPYICFDTLTPPVLEDTEFNRKKTGDERLDNKGYKRRIGFLHPGHRVVAPYAQHLRITLYNYPRVDDVVAKFFGMCLTAGLLKSKLFRCEGPNVIEADHQGFFTAKRLYQLECAFEKLPWPVAFQLEALLHNCILHTEDIMSLLPRVETLLKSEHEHYVASFLRSYHEKLQARSPRESPLQCFERIKREFNFADSILSPGNFMCCHVTFTPTRMILEGPYATQSNRVIRRYSGYLHHFIRVDFRDEDRLQYRWDREVDGSVYLQERVGGILKTGFKLAGRSFEFLAYSTSALKEHSVWFMEPFQHKEYGLIDSQNIRDSLGDFKGTDLMKCPSKYAARLAQAFTATDPSVSINRHQWMEIPDMGTEPYLFTDGVGTISQALGNQIWQALCAGRSDQGKHSVQPSAYQIRFLGYKGMVSVDRELDNRSDGILMQLRPSMKKFSTYTEQEETADIEIARAFDYPNTCYLNRPLIMLLEDLGVARDSFVTLQESAIADARTIDESAQQFQSVLDAHSLGQQYRVSHLLQRLEMLGLELHAQKQKSSFDYPFLRQVRDVSRLAVLRDIKHHARIPVPKSYLLVGVADEGPAYQAAGMENVYNLKPGQIYACVQESHDSEPVWLRGACSISRSPVAHVGDVQRVVAIGRPPEGMRCMFAHMKNVVVLPSVGVEPPSAGNNLRRNNRTSGFSGRSLASMLGGGDLDGDLFSIICYEELLPDRRERPAAYAAPDPFKIKRDTAVEDICDFIVEYIHSDVLGLLSNRLLVIADQSKDGMFDENCKKLAELCSQAVDYPKHGNRVEIDGDKLPRALIRCKPDWHGAEVVSPNPTDYYESNRALGVLFRRITLGDPEPISNKPGETAQPLNDSITLALEPPVRRHIVNTGSEDFSSAMSVVFRMYADELSYVCATHVLKNEPGIRLLEAEVVAGTILAQCTQHRWRTDRIYKMRLHASTLVRQVYRHLMDDLNNASPERLVAGLQNAWEAWKYSRIQGSAFGAGSFGLIALGVIFDCLDKLGGVGVPDPEYIETEAVQGADIMEDAVDSYLE